MKKANNLVRFDNDKFQMSSIPREINHAIIYMVFLNNFIMNCMTHDKLD